VRRERRTQTKKPEIKLWQPGNKAAPTHDLAYLGTAAKQRKRPHQKDDDRFANTHYCGFSQRNKLEKTTNLLFQHSDYFAEEAVQRIHAIGRPRPAGVLLIGQLTTGVFD